MRNLPHPVSLLHGVLLVWNAFHDLQSPCVFIYLFTVSSSACRTASACNQYSVGIEFKVFWRSWQSPASTPALLISGSSLISCIVTTLLRYWQTVEQWLKIPGQRENRQRRTLYCFLLALQICLLGLVILWSWLNSSSHAVWVTHHPLIPGEASHYWESLQHMGWSFPLDLLSWQKQVEKLLQRMFVMGSKVVLMWYIYSEYNHYSAVVSLKTCVLNTFLFS